MVLVIGDETSIGSHTVLMAGTMLGSTLHRRRRRWRARAVRDRRRQRRRPRRHGRERHHHRCAHEDPVRCIHHCVRARIEDDVFIAPMVVTTNDNYMGRTEKRHDEIAGCTIRRGARVGGGAHILPGIEIGEEAFVATAAVVTRDVPPRHGRHGRSGQAGREACRGRGAAREPVGVRVTGR